MGQTGQIYVFGSAHICFPQQIKVNNKLEIPESFLVLSPMVKELRTGDTSKGQQEMDCFRDLGSRRQSLND